MRSGAVSSNVSARPFPVPGQNPGTGRLFYQPVPVPVHVQPSSVSRMKPTRL